MLAAGADPTMKVPVVDNHNKVENKKLKKKGHVINYESNSLWFFLKKSQHQGSLLDQIHYNSKAQKTTDGSFVCLSARSLCVRRVLISGMYMLTNNSFETLCRGIH